MKYKHSDKTEEDLRALLNPVPEKHGTYWAYRGRDYSSDKVSYMAFASLNDDDEVPRFYYGNITAGGYDELVYFEAVEHPPTEEIPNYEF